MKKILVFALALMLAIPALGVCRRKRRGYHRTGNGDGDGGCGYGDGNGKRVRFG